MIFTFRFQNKRGDNIGKLENCIDIALKKQIISESDTEIIRYGLIMLISTIMTSIFLMLIGIVVNQKINTVVFIITMIFFKTNCGGYHSNTYMKCLTLTLLIYLYIIAMTLYLGNDIKKIMQIFYLASSSIIIVPFAPIIPKKYKSKNIKIIKVKLRLSIVIFFLWFILIYLNMQNMYYDIFYVLFHTLFMVSLLMMPAIHKMRKESMIDE